MKKDQKKVEPRMNEAELSQKVADSVDRRSQSEEDGERARRDEAEGSRHTRDKGHNAAAEEGRTDRAQTHNITAESQNVRDDSVPPIEPADTERARNKATEGIRQNRDGSGDSTNTERNKI
jgi:hypothetical protein